LLKFQTTVHQNDENECRGESYSKINTSDSVKDNKDVGVIEIGEANVKSDRK
jgi:hypothetical protein